MTKDDSGNSSLGRANPRTGLTVFLFVLLVLIGLALILASAVLGFVSDSCVEGRCDDGLVTIAGHVPWIGIALTVIASLVWAASRGGRHESTWWVPLAGIACTVIFFVAGWVVLAAGTHLSLNDFFGPVSQ